MMEPEQNKKDFSGIQPTSTPTHPADLADKAPLRPETGRRIWLQIYLPLAIGVLVIAGLGVGAWASDFGTASAWGDVGLVIIMVQSILLGTIALAMLAGLTYGVGWLTGLLPRPMRRGEEIMARAAGLTRRASNVALKPMFTLQATWAAVKAVFRGIVSIFRSV
jgi:hypothetical protein